MKPRAITSGSLRLRVSRSRSAALFRFSPNDASRCSGDDVHRPMLFGLYPYAAIADVGGFERHVLGELALHRDVPLVDALRTAAVAVVVVADVAVPPCPASVRGRDSASAYKAPPCRR